MADPNEQQSQLSINVSTEQGDEPADEAQGQQSQEGQLDLPVFDPEDTTVIPSQGELTDEQQIYDQPAGNTLFGWLQSVGIQPANEMDDINQKTQQFEENVDVAKGVAHGITQAPQVVGNFLNSVFSGITQTVGQATTGKSADELIAENPQLYGEFSSNWNPEMLRPNTAAGEIASGLTQGAVVWWGLAELGVMAGIDVMITGGTSALAKNKMLVDLGTKGTAAMGGEGSALVNMVQKAGGLVDEAIKTGAQASVSNFVGWGGHQGNFFTMLNSLGVPGTEYLGDTSKDGELEGRWKNFAADMGFMTATFPAVALARLTHSMKKFKPGQTTNAELKEILKEVEKHTEEIKKAIDEADVAQATKATQQAPKQTEGETGKILDETLTPMDGPMSDLQVNPKTGQLEDAQTVQIIQNSDTLDELIEKLSQKANTDAGERALIYQAKIKRMTEQFSQKAKVELNKIKESIREKLRRGEPVDIQEELAAGVNYRGSQNQQTWRENFNEVLQAALTDMRKVYTEKELIDKAQSLFGSRGGWDGNTDLHPEDFAVLLGRISSDVAKTRQTTINMLADRFQAAHINLHYNRLRGLFAEAELLGDAKVSQQVWDEMEKANEVLQKLAVSDALLGSEQGLALRVRQIKMEDMRWNPYGMPGAGKFGRPNKLNKRIERLIALLENEQAGNGVNEQYRANLLSRVQNALYEAEQSGGEITRGLFMDIFYNTALAKPQTTWGIFLDNLNNFLLLQPAAEGIGSAYQAAGAAAKGKWSQATQELEKPIVGMMAGARYISQGIDSLFGNVIGSKPHGLDYYHPNATYGIISAEQLERALGQETPGMAQRVMEGVRAAIRIPITKLIDTADAPFRVSGQRAHIFTQLFEDARAQGMSLKEAWTYSNFHEQALSHDISVGRSIDWNNPVKLSNEAGWSQNMLEQLDKRLRANNDYKSLRMGKDQKVGPYYDPSAPGNARYSFSDRAIFKQIHAANEALDTLPAIISRSIMPFGRTLANIVTRNFDYSPLMAVSSYNRAALVGELGKDAQSEALGRLTLGWMAAGVGVQVARGSIGGWTVSPTATNADSERFLREEFNTPNAWTTVTRIIPDGPNKGMRQSVDLSRFSGPLAAAAATAHLYRAATSKTADATSLLYTGVMAILNTNATGRQLYGMSQTLNHLASPDAGPLDAVLRDLVKFTGTFTQPSFIRTGAEILKTQDPYLRSPSLYKPTNPETGDIDVGAAVYQSIAASVRSNYPYLGYDPKSQSEIRYDLTGAPVKRLDYHGDTLDISTGARINRGVVDHLFGINYTSNSALANELDRFAEQGLTLPRMSPLMAYQGMSIDTRQFRDPETGRTLWDEANTSLANFGNDGLYNRLDAVVKSDLYKNALSEPTVIRGGGTNQKDKGTRFDYLYENYTMAREFVTDPVAGSLWNLKNRTKYVNADGKTINELFGPYIKTQMQKEKPDPLSAIQKQGQ